MNVRILLVDDHRLVREGLRGLIEKEPDMEVVGEAEDGRTTARLALDLSPDVVLMDITMPDMDGIKATRRLLMSGSAERPAPPTCESAESVAGPLPTPEPLVPKVIALSMHSDRRFVKEMFKAGASVYLL